MTAACAWAARRAALLGLSLGLALGLSLGAAGQAQAASYTFPGAMPAGCSGSNGNYSCGALALGAGDTLAFTGTLPATLTINGDLSTHSSVINAAGSAADLRLVVNGTLRLDFDARVTATIEAVNVLFTASQARVFGSITASGDVTLHFDSRVSGDIRTTTGKVLVAGSSQVGGGVFSTSGVIETGFAAEIAGNISTGGAVLLGQSTRLGGSITGGAGAVSVGNEARVTGAVSTTSGSITLAPTAQSACLRSTQAAAITLGLQATAAGVCCGSTCSSSCVVNNSTYAMPPLCTPSGPTLNAGQRYSFESWAAPGRYLRHRDFLLFLDPVDPSSTPSRRFDSTFVARPGLANSSCWSFESVNFPNHYLRHVNFRLRLWVLVDSAGYRADVTYCLRSGLADAGALSLESLSWPNRYLMSNDANELVLGLVDSTATQRARATFSPREPWALASVDHYELQLPTSALACQSATVTVRACSNSSSPCTSPVTTLAGQQATLTASAGTLANSTVTFDANGNASTTWLHGGAADGSSASITLSGETLPAANARQCCPNGAACSVASSCSTVFNTAGFVVAASTGGGAASVPAQTAGSASATYVLRAVRTNSSTQACEAALVGTSTVEWALQCQNPSTCGPGNLMTLTAAVTAPIASNPGSGVVSTTNVPMSFDAQGNAPFSFSYADAGQVQLHARKTLNGATLAGSSNAFVVRPASLAVSNVVQTAAPNAVNPGAATAGGAVFLRAGESFSATVSALTASGAVTPSFGRESPPQGVQITPALWLPAGGNAGTLANAAVAGGSFSGGVATATGLAYSEVGIITLTPSVAGGSYLGAGAVTGSSSRVGRFVPARFALSAGSVVHRSTLACTPASSFSYLGESFRLGLRLTAQNLSGETTANYTGDFARFNLAHAAGWQLAGRDGSTLFSSAAGRLALVNASGSWSQGVASDVALTIAALRAAEPDGPFDAAFGVAPVDPDGVALTTFDMASGAGGANDRARVSQVALHFGRLRLSNAIGAADRALALPASVQRWSGGAWVTQTQDSCTVVPTTALSFGNLRGTLIAADAAALGPMAFQAGRGSLRLAAPGGGRSGTVDVALSLGTVATDASCLQPWAAASGRAASSGASLAHLRGAWCGSGHDNDPAARASLGRQRTQEHLIHRRESF